MSELLSNIWSVYLDTAPWLLFGLFAAGLVKAYIPEQAMRKWLGGRGFSAVGRAALFGAPLPLCSCGVLPAAIGLRRAGASKEATVSFLISTPETSIDSIAVTYALMGPAMAVYRPVAALTSAIVTGMMVSFVKEENLQGINMPSQTKPVEASCSSQHGDAQGSCCDTGVNTRATQNKMKLAINFAGAELLDDISKWMAFGIILSGIMMTLIPEGWLAQWGGGLAAMLVMLAVGIPMYICASASTPIAASLLLAGVSPGAVLVFLLVGPATNLAGLMLVKQELGQKITLIYVTGIALVSLAMGLILEWLLKINALSMDISQQIEQQLLPSQLSLLCAILLLVLAIPPIRNCLIPFFAPVIGEDKKGH